MINVILQRALLLFCSFLWTSGFCNASPNVPPEHFTTQTLTFRTDKFTSETRDLISTTAKDYLLAVQPTLPSPNKEIVEILLQYPADGTHTYWWPKASEGAYDGSTTYVVINGLTLMKGEPGARTFCCGLTLEVFYKWILNSSASTKMSAIDAKEFKSAWFCRDINSPGPQDALEESKLGTAVSFDKALPGDFVQLWRNNRTGHSVIFVNWIYDTAGERVGLQYWSTQPVTNGIGFASESFGDQPRQINVEHLSVARPSVNN